MSSRTEADRLLQSAALRARLAPILSKISMALALGIVGVFLYQSGLVEALMPRSKPPPLTVEKPEQVTGQSSRLAGFDKENQPYELTAKKGFQDKDKPNLVHMEGIAGSFKKKSGRSFFLSSNTGLYDSKLKEMDMEGQVKIEQPGKFTAVMEKARVSIEQKDLASDVPVSVDFESGKLTAGGIRISQNGRNVLFIKGVKARFEPKASKGGQNK
jgi:lipopolysaccharide export system protein LptC